MIFLLRQNRSMLTVPLAEAYVEDEEVTEAAEAQAEEAQAE